MMLQSAAPKLEAKGEEEVFVPPKPVELKDIPLKLEAPPRSTTFEPPSRVPAPEPAVKSPVSQEGVVKIIGGDVPSRESPSCLIFGTRKLAQDVSGCFAPLSFILLTMSGVIITQ